MTQSDGKKGAINVYLRRDVQWEALEDCKITNKVCIKKNGLPVGCDTKKSSQKQKFIQEHMDKLSRYNLNFLDLFSAVELGQLNKAQTILETSDIDINSTNLDGFTALNVSVLSNNRSMTKMLLQHGAKEGWHNNIGDNLRAQLDDVEVMICHLKKCQSAPLSSIGKCASNIHPYKSNKSANNAERQSEMWERRAKSLRHLLIGWEQTRYPDSPSFVNITVTNAKSITVFILEPLAGALTTKFKLQWSMDMDFKNIEGECEILEWTNINAGMGAKHVLKHLIHTHSYYIRAACGNMKGWGPYKTSIPICAMPSSWRDKNSSALEDRRLVASQELGNLLKDVERTRVSYLKDYNTKEFIPTKYLKKKCHMKQIFCASKLQKSVGRFVSGVYFASIIYSEDKLLVTNDDTLPTIQIDESYPTTFNKDYYWLMKVSCTWENLKSLRNDMKNHFTSAWHFRKKMLSSICQMQSLLGIVDLGCLFYKPLRDANGIVVIVCVQNIQNQKSVSPLNMRWIPITKLQKEPLGAKRLCTINELLTALLKELINYHRSSSKQIKKGLYVSYLKMHCLVDQIQIIVPAEIPNVLPHCKVRENNHISAEEWQILKCGIRSITEKSIALETKRELTHVQHIFISDLSLAIQRLLSDISVKEESIFTHRIYDIEVLEFTKNISFLVICPPSDLVVNIPRDTELLLKKGELICMDIQVFEITHLRCYQNSILQMYAQLSCVLEIDTALATLSHRHAFSTSELQVGKERLKNLKTFSDKLDDTWNSIRWLKEVTGFARKRNTNSTELRQHISENVILSTDDKNFTQSEKSALSFGKTVTKNISDQSCGLPLPMQKLRIADSQQDFLQRSSVTKNNGHTSKKKLDSLITSGIELNGTYNKMSLNSTSSLQNIICNSSPDAISEHILNSTFLETKKLQLCPNDDNRFPVMPIDNNAKTRCTMVMNNKALVCHKTEHNANVSVSDVLYESWIEQDGYICEHSNNTPSINLHDSSGIIQIFTAYRTGLSSGTSLKLHATPQTTCREIINLVVNQLNVAVLLKSNSGPIYTPDMLDDFCLAAVIGTRERCLRDDFKLLLLKNPWKKGRLYIRQKHELLAAIEDANFKRSIDT